MNRLPFRFALIAASIFAFGCLIFPTSAHANVNCSVTYNPANFGAGSAATSTIDYSCTNFAPTPFSFTVCAQIGDPSFPGTVSQPQMTRFNGDTLDFNLYTDPARTTVWVGTIYIMQPVSIAANGTASGSLTYYGLIASGQNASAGAYSGQFFSTVFGILENGACRANTNTSTPPFSGQSGTIGVSATVGNNCTISASNVNLGAVTPDTTAVSGSTSINVNCPNGTAYFIGLAPSNGDPNGAGLLNGTGANADEIPYQLRSVSGTGPTWGNTATSFNVGNGVAGTGDGSTQSFNAFVSIPSANVTPDDYSDTVTINVNY